MLQANRLLVNFLSPFQKNLDERTYPLYIAGSESVDELLATILPPTSPHGEKVGWTIYVRKDLICNLGLIQLVYNN